MPDRLGPQSAFLQMHSSFAIRNAAALAALLTTASCRCDSLERCPAFDAASVPYSLPNAGDSLHFQNGTGTQLVFVAAAPFTSPGYEVYTKRGLFGECVVEDCDARASSEAVSSANRNGTSVLALQYMITSDAETGIRNQTQSSGSVFDYRFAMDETPLVNEHDDTTLFAHPLGTRNYDTLMVKQRDTTGTTADSIAIWRVYIHRPEGVVGFEDRLTGSLFFRE